MSTTPPTFTPRPNVAPNEGGFTALAFSRDGQTLITGSGGGRVRFWPMSGTAQELREGRYGLDPKTRLPSGDAPISGLSVSPDGATVASGGADKTIRLWTIATGELAAALPAQDARISALGYLPDGLLVYRRADGTIRVWDPKAQMLRASLALLPPAAPPAPLPPPYHRETRSQTRTAPRRPPPFPSDANWIAWTPRATTWPPQGPAIRGLAAGRQAPVAGRAAGAVEPAGGDPGGTDGRRQALALKP